MKHLITQKNDLNILKTIKNSYDPETADYNKQ